MRAAVKNKIIAISILVTMSALPVPRMAAGQSLALALEHEVERIAEKGPLWPGFDAITIPMAVFDGTNTYLFRHAAPPNGFSEVADASPAMWVFAGRHPAMTANTSTDLGGIRTATVMLDGHNERPVTDLAAVAIHEAFHVFQRVHHPEWQANEADLFVYPVDDAGLLMLRRTETEALRQAIEEMSPCWARLAMAMRAERFARMDSASIEYERRTELNEGLANYIQGRAGDLSISLPPAGFDASNIRRRAYATGRAMAVLLDRFRPGWQAALEADDLQPLDEVLRHALPAGAEASTCALTGAEAVAMEHAAQDDVKLLADERVRARASFDALPGRRIEVVAGDGVPLWPQGFDPLNVERLDGGVLHTRYVRLGNESGFVEALDGETADITALTEGVGPHPLFNGVRRVVVVVPSDPVVIEADGHVRVTAPGLSLEFEHAAVRKAARVVIIKLGQ